MSRRKTSTTEAQLFRDKFQYYFRIKWTEKGRSGRSFLDEVGKAHNERMGYEKPHGIYLTNSYLQGWKKGVYPSDYLEDIAKVLDIDPSLFSLAGDPEHDSKARNQSDKARFDYAERIGLDKNFMLFILSIFSGTEFAFIREYHYLSESLEGEKDFEDGNAVTLSDESAKDMLCKFKGTFSSKDMTIITNQYVLPCKKDLLYMRLLQDKYSQFLRIEVKELTSSIMASAKPAEAADYDRIWLENLKEYQRQINKQRDLEHRPKAALWECVDPVKTPITVSGKRAISAALKKLGEDPNQIN